MCGRYQVIDAEGKRQDVFPSQEIIALTAQGEVTMRWGFSQPNEGKKLLINARSESAADKPTFSPLLAAQRCLIPAASYYEWDREKKPHIFCMENMPVLYMAGLFRTETDGQKHFVILTRKADNVVSAVHSRMPCMLESEEYRHLWLHSDSLAPALLNMDMSYKTIQLS